MNIITRLITQSDNAILREEMSRLLTGLFKGEIDPKDVFSPAYQHITDGHSLDYSGFIQHGARAFADPRYRLPRGTDRVS